MSPAILFTLALLALVVVWRWQFGFAAALACFLVLRVVGLSKLATENRADVATAWAVFAALVAFAVGYLVCRGLVRPATESSAAMRPLPDAALWCVVFTAGLLGVYHLIVAGIPIFASDIETRRFDFTSSGLFGVPGRMYLFGITMAWIAASANAEARRLPWRRYRPWRWATAFLVLTTLLSGFKGEVSSLFLTIAAIFVIVTQKRVTVGAALRKYWWIAAIPVGYFALVATLYPSYTSTGDPFYIQIFDRLTVIPAEPIQVAMEGRTVPFPTSPVVSDLWYFLHKYTGHADPGSFTFERAVSATIIGVNPASTAWTTPVTVSSFAEVFVSFGMLAALAVQAVSGAVLAYAETAVRRSVLGVIIRAIVGVALFSWVVKGGLAYHLLNYGFVAVALFLVGMIGSSLAGRESRSSRQPASPVRRTAGIPAG